VIEVLSAGPLTTVQDQGRPGHADLGVGPSGAADLGALRLGNRLVANLEGAAALETTLGGLQLRFTVPATIAVTGAVGPISVDGRPVGMNAPLAVPAGACVRLGPPVQGLRSYLAVRGGIDAPPVLGSRSTDLLSGIGPPVLRDGVELAIGRLTAGFPQVDVAPVAPPATSPVLPILPGPRSDWFTPAALPALTGSAWIVSPDSNRIAVRLQGPVLQRAIERELPSEGLLRGAVQVPPNGQPVVFLADHPVTGGYPVIAVVDEVGVDLVAQSRPGDAVRFRLADR
jgi:biotin-dependent carboxylase-like uncharacterized protein